MSERELSGIAKEYVNKQLAVMFKGKRAPLSAEKKDALVRSAMRVVRTSVAK